MKIRPVAAEVLLCRRTDMTKIIVVFRNLRRRLKEETCTLIDVATCIVIYVVTCILIHVAIYADRIVTQNEAENKLKYNVLCGILNE